MERRKVAILGAAGGIGQPLSLLMKLEPASVSHLALYDIVNMGMFADIGHISTAVKVSGHQGEAELKACLEGASVVMIPAGVPRKPGMTRDDLFNINASIVKNLAGACAK
jgi:malate dehydrogenase